jgi:ACR3 family arsenite efflux pump ArsB
MVTTTSRGLSVRDETKPFILIASVLAGLVLNRFLAGNAQWLLWVVNFGVFFVIFAVMLPAEIKELSRAFRKVKPTVLALLVNFVFIPLFAWAMGWLVVICLRTLRVRRTNPATQVRRVAFN